MQKTSYSIRKNNYEDVKKNYSTHRRRNVRITGNLAEDISFKKELKQDIELFFTDNVKGAKNEKENLIFFKIFTQLFNQKIGNVRILEFKNKIQSFVYLYEGKRSRYLSLFINNYPLLNPNFPSLLVNHCLQEFISDKNFDFVGSDLENIAKFNQRFGAVSYQYSIITNSNLTLLKKLSTSYRIISNFAL